MFIKITTINLIIIILNNIYNTLYVPFYPPLYNILFKTLSKKYTFGEVGTSAGDENKEEKIRRKMEGEDIIKEEGIE
jgi:hypothetical protein